MLCCALGLAAIAKVPAWRRLLMWAAGHLAFSNVREAAFAGAALLSTGAGGFAIVTAHNVIHAEMHLRATTTSFLDQPPLCVAPSAQPAVLLADRTGSSPAERPIRLPN